jgi:hypothetical protein
MLVMFKYIMIQMIVISMFCLEFGVAGIIISMYIVVLLIINRREYYVGPLHNIFHFFNKINKKIDIKLIKHIISIII